MDDLNFVNHQPPFPRTKTATEMLTFDGVVLVHLIIQSQLRNKIDLKKKRLLRY